MELPVRLRQAVDAYVEGLPLSDLRRAAERLSRRYRNEILDGKLHVSDALAAKAYLVTRLPATYAAVRQCFANVAECHPGYQPRSLLDIGSGPATVLWAALDQWPKLEEAILVEASEAMREAGHRLLESLAIEHLSWRALRAEELSDQAETAELVTLCYVFDELQPSHRGRLVKRLWKLTKGMLILVEPGTPAGWRRILEAREILINSGAHILAPCAHHAPCPIAPPDWCHFSRKVARSRLHRLAKGGDAPWEDERFIYLAASRSAPEQSGMRVLAPPRRASGAVRLKLCGPDGRVEEKLATRRDGPLFKAARRAEWGDMLEESFQLQTSKLFKR